MSKELPFFKFIPTEWMSGNILLESFELKGMFVDICALYWHRNRQLSIKQLERRYSTPIGLLKRVIESHYIAVKDGKVSIKFLDEQVIEIDEAKAKKREAGKIAASKRWHTHRSPIAPDNTPIAKMPDIRVKSKDIKKEPLVPKKAERIFKKPEEEELMKYGFSEIEGFDVEDGNGFFDHFESNGWKVGGKTAMKDWKAALRNWCRNKTRFGGKKK